MLCFFLSARFDREPRVLAGIVSTLAVLIGPGYAAATVTESHARRAQRRMLKFLFSRSHGVFDAELLASKLCKHHLTILSTQIEVSFA